MTNYSGILKGKGALLVLAMLLVIASRFAMFSQDVTARPQEDGTLVLSERDKDAGVSYMIGVDNLRNEVNGMVEYDRDSAAGLEKYREFNRRELAGILQNMDAMDGIPARITFNKPLNQAEFTEFVDRYGISVNFYTLYMRKPDGRVATIQGSPSDEELVPAAYFNTAVTSVSQEYNPDAELVGWVEIDGVIQANHISKMEADERVFLIDVMQLFLESRLTEKALTKAGVARSTRQELLQAGFAEIYRAPVAWSLYHFAGGTSR